jgi:hypothetical protein
MGDCTFHGKLPVMSDTDRIETRVYETRALSVTDWDEIWTLTHEFYDVERNYAERELMRRQRIALFRMNGALLGMAAIDVLPFDVAGESLIALWTTHVLIRENWRGRNLIQKLGFRTWLGARLRYPFRRIYWFFDTFSYKSYLLLPRNFHRYWPRHEETTPDDRAALIDALATQLYGPAWRPARGIVVRSGQKRLRATAAPLAVSLDADPNMRFFSAVNPGHAEGDMLICLCPLDVGNWFAVARRALARRRKRPH